MAKELLRIKRKISSLFRKEPVVPDYETKRKTLLQLKDKFNVNILVETGTFLGDTVEYFKNKFSKVFSIELAEELFAKARKRFENDANVTILHGDSGKLLKDLIKDLNEPTLFWLDGHYSSEFYMGDEFIKTAKGEMDTPIIEELQTILSSPLDHVVLIDDARLFTGLTDYPTIGRIKKLVRNKKRGYDFSVSNDMIHIIPAK